MAEIANVITTSAGWRKTVYGGIGDLVVPHEMLLKKVPFDSRDKLGSQYSEVVWVSEEGGVIYTSGDGAVYSLAESIAAVSHEALGSGKEISLKSRASFKALTTAVQGGEQAHGRFMSRWLENVKMAHIKRQADVLLNGGLPRGSIATGGAAGTGATQDLTLTLAETAKGFWINYRGRIDIYDSTGVTKRNATGTFTVNRFTPGTASHTMNVTATVAAELNAVTDADIIFPEGAKGVEAAGLRLVAGNTATSYLTIDPATVPEWQGNIHPVGGNLSLTAVRTGLTKAMDRGAMGEMCFLTCSKNFNHFAADVEALRTVDDEGEEMNFKGGLKSLKYHLEDDMVVEFLTSSLVPEAYAVAFPKTGCNRVGSSDFTFRLAGSDVEGELMQVLEDVNAVQLRTYSDELFWTIDPRSMVLFSTIS